jgi:hypothetical protein
VQDRSVLFEYEFNDEVDKSTARSQATNPVWPAVIMQDGTPITFYSRKLNLAQYTTIEKELLSVVETLKIFRTI